MNFNFNDLLLYEKKKLGKEISEDIFFSKSDGKSNNTINNNTSMLLNTKPVCLVIKTLKY